MVFQECFQGFHCMQQHAPDEALSQLRNAMVCPGSIVYLSQFGRDSTEDGVALREVTL